MKKILSVLLIVAVLISCTACGTGSTEEEMAAAEYPNTALTAVCPWGAGGGTDTFLRSICAVAEEQLGQSISVVNTTGGSGATGHAAIQSAEPDGYTFGMITFELNSLNVQGMIDFSYVDMEPLCRLNTDAAAITVPADAPYDTIEDFVLYAKEHPGEVTVGNSGAMGVWHVAAGLFAKEAGIQLKHTPYSDGAAAAVTDLIGGHIDAVSVSAAEIKQYVDAGQLKILAVMAEERDGNFPEVPTMTESGYPVVFGTWRGIAVPSGTPDYAKDALVAALKTAYDNPDFQAQATNLGLGLSWLDADDFDAFLAENRAQVEAIIPELG